MIRKFYTFHSNSIYLNCLLLKRRFSVDVNLVKHEQFIKNFDKTKQKNDTNDSASYIVDSIKDKSRGPRERFHSYPLQENDMYSNKPVWQQLNEIENTWKMKFKYKSRIEAQKKISKAKKSTETLGELDRGSRLVEIDSFRTVQDEGLVEKETEIVKQKEDYYEGLKNKEKKTDELEEEKTKEENNKVKENKETKTDKINEKDVFLTRVDEGTHLINDINLAGDAYYEKIDLNKVSEKNDRSLNSIKPENLLDSNEQSLLTEIFGKGDESYIDATRPSAIIESTTNLEPETWLNMDPNHIIMQQEIMKSKNPVYLLSCIADKVKQMNSVNIATSIHRLAKYTNSYNRYTVCNHETFGKLIGVAEEHMDKFDKQGLSNIFWSIIRLRITPNWIDCLLEQINLHAESLNTSELANCLFCLSKLTRANDSSLELRFKLLSLVQDKINQFQRPLDLTCISTALARLNVRNPVLFGHISSLVLANLNSFKIQEICGVAWAYASLGFTDHLLFGKIKQFIESNADSSNIVNIIHLAWALSKTKEADHDFFLYTISPLVRSHISSLTPRHLTNVAWAYVNAGIEDPELFDDIAAALLHRVDEMTTHDVASSVVAFSHLESHKLLLKKIKARAGLMLNEFTPLQLSKIVAGFAGIADESFYTHLAKVVDSKLHLMAPENVVEILSGFVSANVIQIPLFTKLLNTVSKSCKKMYAEDSLLLLQLLEKLRGSEINSQMSKLFSNLSHNLVEQIEERVARWKCFDITQITTLFNCLKLGDSATSIVNTVAKQLVSCLNRVYKSGFPGERKKEIFLNFVLSTNQLPINGLNVIKTQLAKDSQLIKSFNNFVSLFKVDPEDQKSHVDSVNLLHSCVVLGFSDHVTSNLFDEIVENEEDFEGLKNKEKKTDELEEEKTKEENNKVKTKEEDKNLNVSERLELTSKLIWSLVESNYHLKWVVEKMEKISKVNLTNLAPTTENLDSLVRLMWSCVVLSEDKLLMEFVGHLGKFADLFPSEVLYAQQTALHLLKCMNNFDVILNKTESKDYYEGIQSKEKNPDELEKEKTKEENKNKEEKEISIKQQFTSQKLEDEQVSILKEWLDYQREDLYTKNKNKKVRAKELDHDTFISECLIKMKIPHKTLHVVENIYRISVSFPLENQLLDVIGFTDVLVPQGQIRSSTLLRQRQLQMLGYGLHPLRLSALYESVSGEKAKNLIAETISSFNPLAKEHISFNKMEVNNDEN